MVRLLPLVIYLPPRVLGRKLLDGVNAVVDVHRMRDARELTATLVSEDVVQQGRLFEPSMRRLVCDLAGANRCRTQSRRRIFEGKLTGLDRFGQIVVAPRQGKTDVKCKTR